MSFIIIVIRQLLVALHVYLNFDEDLFPAVVLCQAY